ncbi:MAG: FecCD family ABC transporter permease [Puniceicoccaceae bacterium]
MPVREGNGWMEAKRGRGPRDWRLLWVLAGMLVLASVLSLGLGSLETPGKAVLGALLQRVSGGLWAGWVDERVVTVVMDIRLPRVLVAILVGAALATAGACLQGLFRNPLADPGLIGVSSGGAIGSILAISSVGLLLPSNSLLLELQIPLWAMVGAMVTTFTVYRIARIAGKTHISTLLLAGIAVNALAGAIVGAMLYLSDNDSLRRFTFWTLGSLQTTTWRTFLLMAPFIVIPLAILPGYRRALNAFLLGEAEAYHLGFNTQQTKRVVVGLCALMVGVTVAFCGLIGFVGLVVPHLVRLVWGPDFRRLIPASALLGGLLVLLADLLARTVNAPAEMPIGVVTSLVGAPFFLSLIHRRKRHLSY